ncbi:MAG: phosphotransferase family protein [Geodermatophilaceae bacterium]
MPTATRDDYPLPDPPVDGAPVGAGAADPAIVGPYLAQVLDEPAWQPCTVELIAGGMSNLTYVVSSPAGDVVLRRPPTGSVLPTAHDMAREHRVITALAGTAVPVPRTRHLCTDPGVLGAPFYVMEKVEGLIASRTMPPGFAESAAERRQLAWGLIDVLADLHAVDPDAVGLTGFGRPDGFMQRQVSRWARQWEASRDRERPGLDRLAEELAGSVPVSPTGPIVHGDYRLDNCLLDPDRPGRILAVLDWEMSTLGDPLADLGLLLVYWQQHDDDAPRPTVTPSVTGQPGFPSRREVAARYADRSGRDVTALPWYLAFGFFKLAVVVTGIVARVRAGAMAGKGDAAVAELVDPLVELGRSALARGDLD